MDGAKQREAPSKSGEREKDNFSVSAPAISLPKGGGAIRGIGEKFAANPVTGTGSLSVPISTSPGRAGFGPKLALSYDSGAGNGPFGFGWSLSIPAITRKTDKGLPQYDDARESDVFLLTGAEDLVPELGPDGKFVEAHRGDYLVRRYRPRIEGLFARIERWSSGSDTYWRSISRDNVTTIYGKSKSADSRICDPADPSRIFSWLICESYDDKGNAIVYEYAAEDAANVDRAQANERNRVRTANRYLKRIKYGNGISRLVQPDLTRATWLFEVVFDYDEGHYAELPLDPARPRAEQHQLIRASSSSTDGQWTVRPDPFSAHRAGFEVRTYRRCRRVLMFHRFAELNESRLDELGEAPYLVRSTEFDYADLNYAGLPAVEAELAHKGSTRFASFIQSVTQSGFVRDDSQAAIDLNDVKYLTYLKRSLPPLEFEYSKAKIQDEIRYLDAGSLENLPVGLDGTTYQWVDLDGEGVSGLLTEQGGACFYKPSLGEGRFGSAQVLRTKPSLFAMASGGTQLLDLSGNGQLDVVSFADPTPGFYERTQDEDWEPFRTFRKLPNLRWGEPNLRFVDLDGDGHADILITEHEVFTWYPSLAEDGFGPARQVRPPLDEESGPRLVLADGTQSIYLADLCGDGLTDLVRIRNGEVCYWPNLGYGRFGAKVTMDNAPWFDNPDQFDERRIRLADIDGSGTIDIIYLGRDGVRLYFNQSGNRWSEARRLPHFPRVDNLSSVMTADLLGNGTACLVWSSPLPAAALRPLRYIDLMGGQKPHLLIKSVNNLGAETRVEYTASTKFYLADKLAGKPWITRLPFPVHCVTRVTVTDSWRKTTFSTTYSYHHGHFDGVEREFRGFGRVEQIDSEDYGTFSAGNVASPYITNEKELFQPPIKSVTWFHTGAFLDRERILSHFKDEYFPRSFEGRNPAAVPFAENDLPEPDLDAEDLTANEWREALRACKGMPLRQEIYELDVDALAQGEERPVKLFSTAYHNCHIQRVQKAGENRHAVFLATESEAITYHYELDLTKDEIQPDPRIVHTLNLNVDRFGHVLQSVAVAYPRLGSHENFALPASGNALIEQVQSELHVVYTETRYTDDEHTDKLELYRLPLPCEVETYELTGIGPRDPQDMLTADPRDDRYFAIDELRSYRLSERHQPADPGLLPVGFLDYHKIPNGTSEKRLVERVRTLFFDDESDTAAPTTSMPFGRQGPRGLKYEDYKLALTDMLLDAVFKRREANGTVVDLLANALDAGGPVRQLLQRPAVSGYVSGAQIDPTGAAVDPTLSKQYWMASGIAAFATDAATHFYLPEAYKDAFGNKTTLAYGAYDLFVASSTDDRGNTVEVTSFDFRVLMPREMRDVSGNYGAVAFDALGMPVASAVMGKNGTESGDNLTAVDPDLTIGTIEGFFTNPFTKGVPEGWLGAATARYVYDLGEQVGAGGSLTYGQRPAAACGIVREKHVGLAPAGVSKIQVAVEYSDGTGAVLVKKAQAEPDPQSTGAQPPLQWIASGKTILNNKGKPVKQYEPYFSDTEHCFDPTEAEREVGVTPVMYYDGPGRLVRTELPDGTLSRVEFSPWHVKSFDPNDTVLESSWYQASTQLNPALPLKRDVAGAIIASPEERAAWLAAQHAGTPGITILDSLGREVIALAHNRVEDPNGSEQFDGRKWRNDLYLTFTKLDTEGKPLWIRDALGNLVMQYITPTKPTRAADEPDPTKVEAIPVNSFPCYDIAGNLLFQHSMDSGDRWMLTDAVGKPMLAWDFNKLQNAGGAFVEERRVYFAEYDTLHRPTKQWLRIDQDAKTMVERFEYQDAEPNDTNNLNAQLVRHYDPSGLVETVRRDFKGSVESVKRTLASDAHASLIDWQSFQNPDGSLKLNAETFTQLTEYDALSRMTRQYNWHRDPTYVAVYEPTYSERGLLKSEKLLIGTSRTAAGPAGGVNATRPDAIQDVRYNVKGQKELVKLGNGTTSRYEYDGKTFRLTVIETRRAVPAGDACSSAFRDPSVIQDLRYTYDPVGNITEIADAAQATVFHANQQIDPINRYEYDALYRLTQATGKENGSANAAPTNIEGRPRTAPCPAPDPAVLRNYTQSYQYDAVGNIQRMRHLAGTGSWTRDYAYAHEDPAQPASNRLWQTWTGGDRTQAITYDHDTHGNMLNLERTAPEFNMRWDHRDMIRSIDLGGGGVAYYQYDAGKQRTRKRIDNQNDLGGYWERIYLGGYELYRRYNGNGTAVVEEIETHHLFEGEQRVLVVDDVITPSDTAHPRPDGLTVRAQTLFRYQYSNHLGSACLELDEGASIISYEEYHPYGTSAYRAMKGGIEAPSKRYRYTGMERDEESGLGYHGARYYSQSLGVWVSPDPTGIADGPAVYTYCHRNPVTRHDRSGAADVYPPPTNFLPPNVLIVPVSDDPALSDVATQVREGMRSTKYENLSKTLHRNIRSLVQGPEANPLQTQFSVDSATRRLVFKSGPFKDQFLEFAHDVSQSQIRAQGIDPLLAIDTTNLYPVGHEFHADWLHTLDHIKDNGKLPSIYDDALGQPGPFDAALKNVAPKVATPPDPNRGVEGMPIMPADPNRGVEGMPIMPADPNRGVEGMPIMPADPNRGVTTSSTEPLPSGWRIPAYIVAGAVVAVVLGVVSAVLAADDVTLVGVANDPLLLLTVPGAAWGGNLLRLGTAAAF
jgi:RHS repeat-associated protein